MPRVTTECLESFEEPDTTGNQRIKTVRAPKQLNGNNIKQFFFDLIETINQVLKDTLAIRTFLKKDWKESIIDIEARLTELEKTLIIEKEDSEKELEKTIEKKKRGRPSVN